MLNAVQGTDSNYNHIVSTSIPVYFQLYAVTVLHIKCIFTQWMQALQVPREREQLLLWRCSVV